MEGRTSDLHFCKAPDIHNHIDKLSGEPNASRFQELFRNTDPAHTGFQRLTGCFPERPCKYS